MLTKNKLKKLWSECNFRPVKRFGQNFLIDKNIQLKILENLDVDKNDTVIEIGAGFGEMTEAIAEISKKVLAVERDKKITGILKSHFELSANISIIEKDFLDVDIKKFAETDEKFVIYGNLPYYITSPILDKLIKNISVIKSIYIVVQKEVAERILAMPGTKEIGRLSLFIQYHTRPKRILRIKKECFYPEPQVESVFLKLEVPKKHKLKVANEELLFSVIKKAYGQRRKTLLNSLVAKELKKAKLLAILQSAGINPSARPETLSLSDFAKLTNMLETHRK